MTSNPAARIRLRRPPYAFTEHGAIQAANVLNSARAAEMSVHVVCAFVRLRVLLASNAELAKKFDELERRVERRLTDQDDAILDIFKAIRQLTETPSPKKRPISFVTPKERMNNARSRRALWRSSTIYYFILTPISTP